MLLSVVFSFRNEAENLRELARRVDAAIAPLQDVDYELVFVNDDSTDNSLELLKQLKSEYPITIVNMSRRFGVTPCVLAGFAHATGDAVVYMDADLQDPPELIPEMIAKFREGAEVVHTTRTKREGESLFKMWITRRAYRIINFFSGIRLQENTGDFKLLSRKIIDHILALKERDPYMRGISVWFGYKQDYVYYERDARFSGASKFPLFHTSHPREVIRGIVAFSTAPLYVSFFAGLISTALAGLLIIYALVTKVLGLSAPGVSGILIAIAFFGGAILMSTGIIGIYIARIFEEVRDRPQYIVKDVDLARKP